MGIITALCVIVSYGCGNKLPKMWLLKTIPHSFFPRHSSVGCKYDTGLTGQNPDAGRAVFLLGRSSKEESVALPFPASKGPPPPHSLVCGSLFPSSEPARTGQVLTQHRSDLASIVISPSLTPTLLPPFKGSLQRHWAHLDNLPISRSAN